MFPFNQEVSFMIQQFLIILCATLILVGLMLLSLKLENIKSAPRDAAAEASVRLTVRKRRRETPAAKNIRIDFIRLFFG